MAKFTFVNIQGHEITVEAQSETRARELAMHVYWGPPDGRVTFEPYRGDGLILTRAKEGVNA